MARPGFSKRRWFTLAGVSAVMLLFAAYLGLLYLNVEAVTYFKNNPRTWAAVTHQVCLHWQDKYVFGDLRPGSKDPFSPLELSCRQAIGLPADRFFVSNNRGQKIHYLRYNQDRKQTKRPIMLYVHGIAVNYVTGLKFYPMAKRLGFELVIMELSNHGESDDNGMGAAYGCREASDLVAVVADLIKRDPQRPILIFGSSMGAMTIADAAPELTAFQKNVKAVVLENPQSSLRDILGIYAHTMHFPDFHTDLVAWLTGVRAGIDYTSCAPVKRLPSMTIPTWVEISEKDFMVPTWMAKKVYDSLPVGYPNLYKQYPYGEHGAVWNGQPQQFEADLKQFWKNSQAFTKPAI